MVFRGFTSGNFEAFKLVNKKRVEAAELKAATLKTDVKKDSWSCEWNIPLALLGVTVEESQCTRCGACADVCPVGAISQGDTQYQIDAGACLDCGTCADTCPNGAIAPEE